jgi:hypothetical protein
LACAAEDGEENCVHAEDLPRHVPDREIEIVQFSHPKFLRALTDLGEDMGQECGQRVAIQIRREFARYH